MRDCPYYFVIGCLKSDLEMSASPLNGTYAVGIRISQDPNSGIGHGRKTKKRSVSAKEIKNFLQHVSLF